MAKRLHTRYGTWSHAAFLLEREKEIIMIMTRHMRRNSHSAEKKYMPLAKKNEATENWQPAGRKIQRRRFSWKAFCSSIHLPYPAPWVYIWWSRLSGTKLRRGKGRLFQGFVGGNALRYKKGWHGACGKGYGCKNNIRQIFFDLNKRSPLNIMPLFALIMTLISAL